MRSGPTNIYLKTLIRDLKKLSNKEKVEVWRAIAENLEISSRRRKSINLGKINRYAHDNETVVVPGKVLGVGQITKKISICAFDFSSSAQLKFKNTVDFYDLMKKDPKGKTVRILT